LDEKVTSNLDGEGQANIVDKVGSLVVLNLWWGHVLFFMLELSQLAFHIFLLLLGFLGLRFVKRRRLSGLSLGFLVSKSESLNFSEKGSTLSLHFLLFLLDRELEVFLHDVE
jgi:hypothetical protein